MNAPLVAAGCLALLAAAIHGVGGEVWVVRKVTPGTLPSTRLGGAGMTRAMIQASWHMTTVGFLTVGAALLLAGTALDDDVAEALAVVAAAASTGFAAVAVAAANTGSLRSLLRHPAPLVLTSTAALAWWGAVIAA